MAKGVEVYGDRIYEQVICGINGLAIHSVWSNNAWRPDENLGHDANSVPYRRNHRNNF